MSIPEGDASTIKFGTGLAVTDEGANVIRVDASETTLIADLTIDALDPGGFPISGAPTQFDVTGIPGIYSDLIAVLSFHSAEGLTNINLNNDHTGNYFYARPYRASDTINYDTTTDADNKIGLQPVGPGADPDRYCQYTILIPGYASSTWAKTFQIQGVAVGTGGTGTLVMLYDLVGGVWLDTAPVTRLTVAAFGTGGFTDGSRLRLYGRT